jgi:probable O-glycosylation ligase (exosortase A-associated)
MRDIFILLMLLFLVAAAFRRPFLMTLGYLYVDLVQPQQVSYYLLNSVPVSLIFGAAAVLFWLLFDDKRRLQFGRLQGLMLLFLAWITVTTFNAQLPEDAWTKWDPAWKAIVFGAFLPFVLRTRQRIEGAALILVLSVGTLTITGGIKTLLGGGGYGMMQMLVSSNSGLYEGSTISAIAIAMIPLILYLYRFNQIVPRSRVTLLLTAGLIFSALLIPIGTEARTGLVCIAALAGLMFLRVKRKMIYVAAASIVAIAAIPLLPESFTGRMSTIKTYEADNSATTRLAVWGWTLDFVKEHPFGGGFYVYKINEVEVTTRTTTGEGNNTSENTLVEVDQARAFHSSYFEVLGEHGWPGIAIYLAMHGVMLWQLRGLYQRFKDSTDQHWIADFARSLSHTTIIYMVGSLFIGIAFQSTLYYLLAFAASLAQVAARVEAPARKPVRWRPLGAPTASAG